jgi:hypothetical protein
MKIISIKDDPSIIDFLKDNLRLVSEPHLLDNYHPDNESFYGNIFRIIKDGRFDIGNYYVMIADDGEYVGSAGWNQLDESTALALVRMYVPKKFRAGFIMGEHVLPILINETSNYQHTWVTFNSYNKPMYTAMERIHSGKSSSLTPWPAIYRKFKPLGQHTVNNTLQYVAEYERSIP